MAKVRLDGQQVLDDIRSGMDGRDLMKKYNLSAKGLESLFGKLLRIGVLKRAEVDARFKVEIKARDVLQDIRNGMGRSEFAQKYRLSGKGMQSLFTKMLSAGAVTQSELDRWMACSIEGEAGGASACVGDFDDWLSSFEETVDLSWLEKESKP